MTKATVYLIVSLTSLLFAVGAGAYAYERYTAAQESLRISNEQYAEAQTLQETNLERHLELMDYSTDNLRIYNEDMFQVKLGGGVALLLLIDGIVFLSLSRRSNLS